MSVGCDEVRSRAQVGVVRRAVAALNAGDVKAYLSAFDPECVRRVSGIDQAFTLGDVRENLEMLAARLVPLYLREDILFGADDQVCAVWTLCGRHTGEFWGAPPTGRRIEVQTCEVYSFVDAVIVVSRVFGNPVELFEQIKATGTANR
jgi:predicted ester cyclase